MSTKGREYNEEHEQAAFKEEQEHAETKPFGKTEVYSCKGIVQFFYCFEGTVKR